jgi:hypothetical protein
VNQHSVPGSVLIGLVTHPTSKYNQHGEALRILEVTADMVRAAGWQVVTYVSDKNQFAPEELRLTRTEIAESAWAQAHLERRWNSYVRQGSHSRKFTSMVSMMVMAAKRSVGALSPRPAVSRDAKSLVRLKNIDAAHESILSAAVNKNVDLVLVLEDDALPRMESALEDLPGILSLAKARSVALFQISESISGEVLGVEQDLLNPVSVASVGETQCMELSRPITNTVCANIYSAEFAARFASRIRESVMAPIVPIDWRLNEVLLDHPSVSCWWAVPGVFQQGSMVSE